MIATEYKKQALNVSGNIAVYNTDTSDLNIVHLGGSGNYTDYQQIIGSLNYKTDIGGGYVTTLNPENIVTDVAKIIDQNDFDQDNNIKISHGKKQHVIVKII